MRSKSITLRLVCRLISFQNSQNENQTIRNWTINWSGAHRQRARSKCADLSTSVTTSSKHTNTQFVQLVSFTLPKLQALRWWWCRHRCSSYSELPKLINLQFLLQIASLIRKQENRKVNFIKLTLTNFGIGGDFSCELNEWGFKIEHLDCCT